MKLSSSMQIIHTFINTFLSYFPFKKTTRAKALQEFLKENYNKNLIPKTCRLSTQNYLSSYLRFFYIVLFIFLMSPAFSQVKIVVLGSSTAAGTGPSHPDFAWVNRYRVYLQDLDADNIVINLAQGGYTTYHILPTGTTTPANRPNPDASKNITAALNENPDAIIINLPSNDAASSFTIGEQLANYDAVLADANAADVPVWIATPQGRNLDLAGRNNLIEMKDSTYAIYGEKAIDFWTYVGQGNGSLNSIYDSGDGVHMNDNGHNLLFNRVVDKNIPEALLVNVDTKEALTFSINLFPNPTTNVLFLDFEQPVDKEIQLSLINSDGRLIQTYLISKNVKKYQINTSKLPIGSYLLVMKEDLNSSSVLFIKQ